MGDNVKIRNMEKDDLGRVVEIYRQGIELGESTFQKEAPTPDVWDGGYMEPCRLVAEVDGDVAGWVALTSESDGCTYRGVAEVSIYIDSNEHGKGIGKKLTRAVIEESEKNGIWTLQATILEGNTGSLKVSEACGFRRIGVREKIDKDLHGKWRDAYFLERRSKVAGVD